MGTSSIHGVHHTTSFSSVPSFSFLSAPLAFARGFGGSRALETSTFKNAGFAGRPGGRIMVVSCTQGVVCLSSSTRAENHTHTQVETPEWTVAVSKVDGGLASGPVGG